MRLSIAHLVTLLTTAATLATATPTTTVHINPDGSTTTVDNAARGLNRRDGPTGTTHVNVDGTTSSAANDRRSFAFEPAPRSLPQTNAERFARGLPPLKPRRRSLGRKRSYPSGVPCVPISGHISATSTSALGFVSATWTRFKNYGRLVPTTEGALRVSFCYDPLNPSQLTLTAENSLDPSFPLFGGVTGAASSDSNLNPGSYNYAFLTGTTTTPVGSGPVVAPHAYNGASISPTKVESPIWSYDVGTSALTANWINSDLTSHPTSVFIADFGDTAFFGITADFDAFNSRFGNLGFPVTELTFKFVPI